MRRRDLGNSETRNCHNYIHADIYAEAHFGEKFNDFQRINANLVERSTVNTNDILVLGEKINDSLIVSE